MDILNIKKFNDNVLRKKAERVKNFDSELELLVFSMKKTMLKNEGIGLAAPQVGISKKVFVFMDIESGEMKEIINPEIIKKWGKTEKMEEGCLSFPGIFLEIKRKNCVKVKGFNVDGREIEIEAKGIISRILQHEIDHLEGILFFDRLPLLKRIKFLIKNRGFSKYINN